MASTLDTEAACTTGGCHWVNGTVGTEPCTAGIANGLGTEASCIAGGCQWVATYCMYIHNAMTAQNTTNATGATTPHCEAVEATWTDWAVTTPQPNGATVVTSTGKIELKMSKVDATALTTSPQAKEVFASAIANTLHVPLSDVTIIAIYVDGVLVAMSRRLENSTESTVKVDWRVKAAAAIDTTVMDANTLKTNIVNEAQTKASLTIVITAVPTVTVAVVTIAPGDNVTTGGNATTTTAPDKLHAQISTASSNCCLALLFLMGILGLLL